VISGRARGRPAFASGHDEEPQCAAWFSFATSSATVRHRRSSTVRLDEAVIAGAYRAELRAAGLPWPLRDLHS
jgi:hypothetical protein